MRAIAILLLLTAAFAVGNTTSPVNNLSDTGLLKEDYYPIYELSPNSQGLTIELTESDSLRNTIDNLIFKKHSEIKGVDTGGQFYLAKIKQLEPPLAVNVGAKFFVYCTKGYTESVLKDIVFSIDSEGCKSAIIAFRINKIDINKFGHPLFCSKRKLVMEYASDSAIAFAISEKHRDRGYWEKFPSKVYACHDSFYYAYEDDFIWGTSKMEKHISWPGRSIWCQRKDGSIYEIWSVGLDLFGIPCD